MRMDAGLRETGRFLKRQGFVRLAYVFGSRAEGRAGPLSDTDIAVLFKEGMGRKEMSAKKLQLINRISSMLKTDNFDLVVMNDAPLSMRSNIIKHGVLLKDGGERVTFETRTMSDYLDRKYYDDMYAEMSVKRIAKEGIM